MASISALTLADARLLVLVSSAIVNHPDDISRVITPLVTLSKSSSISFTTLENLLKLLVTYTSPISVSATEISALAHALVESDSHTELSENDLIEDVESLANWVSSEFQIDLDGPEEAMVQIAKDLAVSLATKSQSLSFNVSAHSGEQESLLFAFSRAKCLQLSTYYDNITPVAESFDSLRNYTPFQAWYHGIILPYNYFHQNYAVPSDTAGPESEYLSLKSYADFFEFLALPLNSSVNESLASKLLPRAYFSNVLLPLAVYHLNDLDPVIVWIFKKHSSCDVINDFEFWDEILRTILTFHNYKGDTLAAKSYESLIRNYIFSCLYFGLYKGENIGSFSQAKIQSQIQNTLSYLVETFGSADLDIFFNNETLTFPEYKSLQEFTSSPPAFVKLILEGSLDECITYMLQVFTTCCSLHSLNELTVRKFFVLKSQANSNGKWFHKEVMRIFASDTQNHDQTMRALGIFSESFLSQNTETVRELDQLIFESFLQSENFDKAIDYFKNLPNERKLPAELVFQLVSRKFWDLFDNASNLDDRLGKLKLANSCIDILDTISQQGGLSEESRRSIVKIKHLLKAIHSLKNFKLVIVRNEPVTPKLILSKVTSSGSEQKYPQFSIISMVLEQNPKSYLAHERLHKIVNDLAIYADLDVSVVSFPKIQSACVESALIDGNFDFAYKQTKTVITYYLDTQNTENFNEIWLMFYQVGKYILPEWFGDYDVKVQEEKIGILLKQREILSLAIKYTKPNAFSADNSRLLVGQFRHVNEEIKKWHQDADLHRSEDVQDAFQSTQKQIQDNITGFINEASHSKNQASEKISNLFVSGLGWAIGARR